MNHILSLVTILRPEPSPYHTPLDEYEHRREEIRMDVYRIRDIQGPQFSLADYAPRAGRSAVVEIFAN